MFCHKCGNKIAEDAAFCQKCGTKLHNDEPDTGSIGAMSTTSETVRDEGNYDVILANEGKDKITVIKTVKELMGLGLAESKSLVDNVPKTLKKAVTKAEAESIITTFTRIGAVIIIKHCPNCGGRLTDDSEVCSVCGWEAVTVFPIERNPISTGSNVYSNTSESQNIRNFNGTYCPNCKSTNLQTIVETNTESKGGGYGAGKGCLGYLLLGPLGLLCGACGSKAKIKTTNQIFFICMDCGKKFREAKELAAEKSKDSILCFIAGAAFIVGGIILASTIIGPIIGIAIGGLFIYGGFAYKKESEEIRVKQYEAECYKEQKK